MKTLPLPLPLRVALLTLFATSALPLAGQTFLDKFTSFSPAEAVELYLDKNSVPQTTSVAQTGLTSVLGGERTSTLTRIGTNNTLAPVGFYISDVDTFAITNAASTKTVVKLEYGLSNAVSFNFGSLGAQGIFRLVNWQSDNAPVDLALTLRSGGGVDTQTKSLPTTPSPNTTHLDFAFTLFDQINFSSIDDITLTFTNTDVATDATAFAFAVGTASSLSAIPEPQTYALALVVLTLGVVAVRRRTAAGAVC